MKPSESERKVISLFEEFRNPLLRYVISPANSVIPDHELTPGATRTVSIGDVCSMPHEEVVRDVPSSLREEVFMEYGILNPRLKDYEIDYLIASGSGFAEDIYNLWPEPSTYSDGTPS